jgi:hypothetical protein
MDPSALNNLLIAKRLLSTSTQFSLTSERHACTAGSIALLDALELVLLACLMEKKVSPTEHAHLDKLIVDAEKAGLKFPHKTRIIGLNRSRGGSKHFGNTIDQYALQEFLKYTLATIDQLVIDVFGKPYHEIYSAELVQHLESKDLLKEAARILDATPFYPYACLLNIRKAIFINFEERYSIEEWKDIKTEKELTLIEQLIFKKSAPFYTRKKEWIDQHVLTVFDYVQFDYSEIRSDFMEYGNLPANFFNLLRLTPRVFRSKDKGDWKAEGNPAFMETTKETTSYCLSTAIEMVLLKESYAALHRPAPEDFHIEVQATKSTYLYRKASINSEQVQRIESGDILVATGFIPSFDDDSTFLAINEFKEATGQWVRGYIPEKHINTQSSL